MLLAVVLLEEGQHFVAQADLGSADRGEVCGMGEEDRPLLVLIEVVVKGEVALRGSELEIRNGSADCEWV